MAFHSSFMKRGVTLLAFLFAFACIANADTIYNNLGSITNGSDSIGFGSLGNSFSTGSSVFSVEQVTLKLSAFRPEDGHSIAVWLGSGSVGETIGTLNDSSLSTSPENVPFTLSTPFTLAVNTRYWVYLSGSELGSADWAWSLDQTAQGVAGEYTHQDIGPGLFPDILGAYQMRVSGTDPAPAPEPGSLFILLVDLSGIGLGWLGWKRMFA